MCSGAFLEGARATEEHRVLGTLLLVLADGMRGHERWAMRPPCPGAPELARQQLLATGKRL